MRPVPLDFFCRLKFPAGLRRGADGAFTFITKQASIKENRYSSTLWLHRGGRLTRLTGPGELSGHWWAGPASLLLARPGTERERAFAKKGLPFTLLQTLPLDGPGEARDLARLFLKVEDAVALQNGAFLLLAVWDPAAEAALAQAGADPEKAAAILEEQSGCEVLSGLPYWENGGGFTADKRKRLYLFKNGKAVPLTDGLTEVSFIKLSPGGKTAWFAAKRFQVKMPLEDRLFRIETDTLRITDVTFSEPFVHQAAVPLSDGLALVAGVKRQKREINKNVSFYRVEVSDCPEQPVCSALLYGGGAYGADGSVATDLSMTAGGTGWQADGGWVYWTSTVGESSHIMRIDAQSGEIQQVSRMEGAVQDFICTEAGAVAIAMRGLAGPEIVRISHGGAEKYLTAFNRAQARRFSFAQPHPLAYTNASGCEIRGWVLCPPGADAQDGEGGRARLPAILNIHGGPKTVYGPVLFHEMQYWASLGFAVIYCNPTGGDGRGDGFADICGRYGEVDYDDIMGFLDTALAACRFIDPERLGVCGGSYGGFMTNWIIGHTHRFKAAVSQRGISNWASMGAVSDIGYYFVPSEMGGVTLWENSEKWWYHSPLKYADNVKTPTLFIHGDQDYRCPLAEGLQMYGALADLGVETRMCLFRGENHELSRGGRPQNRIRRLREITGWFQKYL